MKSFMKILESVIEESIQEFADLNSVQRDVISKITDCVTSQFPDATISDVSIISEGNNATEVIIKFNAKNKPEDNLQQLDTAIYAAVEEPHKELQDLGLTTELHAEWGDNQIIIKGFLYKSYNKEDLSQEN